VSFSRQGDTVTVTITDFISPTIIKRLDLDHTVFRARITDWRSMVDCVMIDPDFDGEVFRVALSDVPASKDDFVIGQYRIHVPKQDSNVAVKIIDMLGEEVILAKHI